MDRDSATVTWKIWIWTACNGCLMPSASLPVTVSYTHLGKRPENIPVLEQAGITVDKFGGEAFRAAVSDGQALSLIHI